MDTTASVEQPTQAAEEQKTPEHVPYDEFAKLQDRLAQLEASKERILAESKDHAGKYRKLRDEVETKEASRLEEQENWKELLEMERNKKFELEGKYKDLKRMGLQQALNFEVARHASDAHSVDDIINALPQDHISIDEDSMKFSGIQEAIQSLRDNKGYLFKRAESPGMVDSRPTSVPKEKTVAEKAKEDPRALLGELLRQKFTTGG